MRVRLVRHPIRGPRHCRDRRILPKVLSKAIQYLDGEELDRLVGAAIGEARRCVPRSLKESSAKAVSSSVQTITK